MCLLMHQKNFLYLIQLLSDLLLMMNGHTEMFSEIFL